MDLREVMGEFACRACQNLENDKELAPLVFFISADEEKCSAIPCPSLKSKLMTMMMQALVSRLCEETHAQYVLHVTEAWVQRIRVKRSGERELLPRGEALMLHGKSYSGEEVLLAIDFSRRPDGSIKFGDFGEVEGGAPPEDQDVLVAVFAEGRNGH